MKRMKLITALLAALLFPFVAVAYEGVNIFDVGHGAKALAMGGAFTAIADDFSAAMWNPAGLVFISPSVAWIGGSTANLYQMDDFDGVSYQYAAGGASLSDSLGLGVSLAYASIGSLYSISRTAVTASVALPGGFAIGVNAKYISETIDSDNEYGFSLDAGAMYAADFGLAIGISARDLFSTDIAEGQHVSATYRLGTAYTAEEEGFKLTLAADFEGGPYQRLHAGIEFLPIDFISLRAGASLPIGDTADIVTYSFGAGIKVEFLVIDAAYIFDGPLGGSWLVALTCQF